MTAHMTGAAVDRRIAVPAAPEFEVVLHGRSSQYAFYPTGRTSCFCSCSDITRTISSSIALAVMGFAI